MWCPRERFISTLTQTRKYCVRECSDGYYAIPDRECRPCHSSCQTCSGSRNHDCLTCKPSFYLLRAGDAMKCSKQCPAGYFTGKTSNTRRSHQSHSLFTLFIPYHACCFPSRRSSRIDMQSLQFAVRQLPRRARQVHQMPRQSSSVCQHLYDGVSKEYL